MLRKTDLKSIINILKLELVYQFDKGAKSHTMCSKYSHSVRFFEVQKCANYFLRGEIIVF